MTINTLREVLRVYIDKNPVIAVQSPISDIYMRLSATCIYCTCPVKIFDKNVVPLIISLYSDSDKYGYLTSAEVLTKITDIDKYDDINTVFIVNGRILDISGMRYDAEKNILILYFEVIKL